MTIEELKKDAEEFAKLLGSATRTRVKNALTLAKAEVDKEIVNLEMKALQNAERQAVAGNATTPKRYLTELNEYAWEQSDKFVKLFITLDGVEAMDEESVTTKFTENSINLLVSNMNGKDYGLTMTNLNEKINVEKSYRKIKTGLIAIYMKKEREAVHWNHLTTIGRRIKEQHDCEVKNSNDNAEDALVNIMKKMYKTGDPKTKQMIAKAWTESQEKIRSGTDDGDMMM